MSGLSLPSELQPISENDRKFLLARVSPVTKGFLAEHGTLLFLTLLGSALYSALALMVFAVVLGVAAHLLGIPIPKGGLREISALSWGALGIVVLISGYFTFTTMNWLIKAKQSRAGRHQSVSADLQNGVVKVEVLDVQGIKLLQEQEHHTFMYLLRLSNGKIFVLYDYDSYDTITDDTLQTHPTLVVCEQITLRSFPISKLKTWDFVGAELPLPEPIELYLGPDQWPEDEGWCRVKWENIERHFGPKASPRSRL